MDGPEDRRRVIGLDARLYAGDYTGIGIYTRGLVNSLARLDPGREYILFTDRAARSPADNFRVVRFGVRKRIVWSQLFLPLRAEARRLDLFHATANYELPLLMRCPAVVTVHDLIPLIYPETVPFRHRKFFGTFIGPAIRKAAAVITDSEFVSKSLVDRFGLPGRKAVTIPLAHDPSFEKPASPASREHVRVKYGLEGKFVLYVGAVEPRKNIPALISAFAQVSADPGLSGWHLVLAGGGGWQKEETLRAARESGLGSRLVLTGFVPDEDLPALYQEASLFVYPSVYEGFGLPVLEAMASGTPVLVSSPTALEELTGRAGATFRLDDPGGLPRALLELMKDDGRLAALAEAGKKRAAGFRWEKTAEKTLEVYRRVLGEIPPGN